MRGGERATLSRILAGLPLAVALLVAGVRPAGAGVCRVGSFTKGTSAAPVTQAVAHGLGETPKALILWTDGKTTGSFAGDFLFGFGMSDGTNSYSAASASEDGASHANASRRMAAKALTVVQWGQSLQAEADLQSWDATNFTLNWTTNNATAYVVHFLAIGGAGVSAKVVNWTLPGAAGNQSVTGVGFTPEVAIVGHAGYALTGNLPSSIGDADFGLGAMDASGGQWASTYHSGDASNKSDTQRYQRTNQVIVSIDSTLTVRKEASFVSMDSDGFTVNFTTSNSSQAQAFALALKGVWVKVGSFTKTTGAATATQALTGLSFRPGAVLLTSVQDTARTAPVAHSRFGIGASDATTGGTSAFQDTDNLNSTSVNAIDKTSKAFVKVDNSTPAIDAEASVASLDAAGFTLSWTTNDAVATEMLYLALMPRRRVYITAAPEAGSAGDRVPPRGEQGRGRVVDVADDDQAGEACRARAAASGLEDPL